MALLQGATMARYSKTALYMVKHKNCDLYIVERAGGAARWDSDKTQAIKQLKEWWDQELNPDVRKWLIFERVPNE